MDTTIEMAVRLARKGASDEVIALVMDAMAPRGSTPPSTPAARSESSAPRRVGRVRLYASLLAAIRQRVSTDGPLESSARDLCDQHHAEWMQSRQGLKASENARGFAAIIAHAVKHNGGVVEGLRFSFLRVVRGQSNTPRGGGGVSIYRVEAA